MIALVRNFFINYLQLISIFWKIAYLRFVIKIPKTVTIKADKKTNLLLKRHSYRSISKLMIYQQTGIFENN